MIVLTYSLGLNINRPIATPYDIPIIAISLYPGRTKEQKDAFARAVTDAAGQKLKTKPEHIIITYDKRPKEDWYMAGNPLGWLSNNKIPDAAIFDSAKDNIH